MKALDTSASTYPQAADYYARDASGNIMSTCKRKNTYISADWHTRIHVYEQPIYGSDRLGVYLPWTETYPAMLE